MEAAWDMTSSRSSRSFMKRVASSFISPTNPACMKDSERGRGKERGRGNRRGPKRERERERASERERKGGELESSKGRGIV